jgi:hypothetical protein
MAKLFDAFSICLEDLVIDQGKFFFEKGEEGRTEIETDRCIIVEDIQNPLFAIHDPRIGIWPIAFRGDPFVPVMKRMGTLLGFDDFKPRVLPRRLIKMGMDGDKGVFHFEKVCPGGDCFERINKGSWA